MCDALADAGEEHDALFEHEEIARSLAEQLRTFTESRLDMPRRYEAIVEQLEALGNVD